MVLSRRAFIACSAAGTLTLFVPDGRGVPRAVAAIEGGSLPVDQIRKFAVPLLVPGVMPKTRQIPRRGGRNIDYYEIAVRQFEQQMLPDDHPATTVWGYVPATQRGSVVPGIQSPSLTIEALQGVPVRVKWRNELVDDRGRFLPHLFAVDPTLHWANPERLPDADGHRSTDIRPDFTGKTYVPVDEFTDPATQYTAYRGPVPIVTHLHGAMGIGDESDGYTEAWFLPKATNLPAGIATRGRWFDFFARKFATTFGARYASGEQLTQYPNDNRDSCLWFHDHALGLTRLNVYAGPAGFYFVRGGKHGEKAVRDVRTGARAHLPGPAPRPNDPPKGKHRYYEIPLAIQDRSFNDDGSLFYPDTRAFFDGYTGPYIPETDLSPIWAPEFFGNTLIVNGQTWPHLDVEQRRYRFRVLNGCQSRVLQLDFRSIPGVHVHLIGNDAGSLPEVVDVTADCDNLVLMAPAERTDLIVDFTDVAEGRHVLRNAGPDDPFKGDEWAPADPDSTGQVMQFRVGKARSADRSTPPQYLRLPRIEPLPRADRVRRLALMEHMSQHGHDGPAAAMLGVMHGDPAGEGATGAMLMWMDPITENPGVGDTEIWEIYNLTMDSHPVHVHEVAFQVLNREDIMIGDGHHDAPTGGHGGMEGLVKLMPDAEIEGPHPGEAGRKDTVICYPGEVTRIKAQFKVPGQFVWHRHILEHEDNEMMRPYRVGPRQPGQPD